MYTEIVNARTNSEHLPALQKRMDVKSIRQLSTESLEKTTTNEPPTAVNPNRPRVSSSQEPSDALKSMANSHITSKTALNTGSIRPSDTNVIKNELPFEVDRMGIDHPMLRGASPATPSDGKAIIKQMSGSSVSQLNFKEIAQFLIGRDYLLTALELYTELSEDGIEVRELRDYFANHSNFDGNGKYHRTMTQVHSRNISEITGPASDTISNFDEAVPSRHSASEQGEIAREKDEYIAVLEYELRQMKDSNEKLRARLSHLIKSTDDTETTTSGLSKVVYSPKGFDSQSNEPSSMLSPAAPRRTHGDPHDFESQGNLTRPPSVLSTSRPDEALLSAQLKTSPQDLRVLNYLVNDYLQTQGYKMTALTFGDENDDQDLEDWEDVFGVPSKVVAPPPHLSNIYRTWRQHETRSAQMSQSGNNDPTVRLNNNANRSIEYSRKASSIAVDPPNLSRFQVLPAVPISCEGQNSQRPFSADSLSVAPAEIQQPTNFIPRRVKTEGERTAQVLLRRKFEDRAPLVKQESGKSEMFALMGYGTTGAHDIGKLIPRIIPTVVLNRREELLPLIVSSILHHSDVETQKLLTRSLFHLMKKPDEKQRRLLLEACEILINRTGNVTIPGGAHFDIVDIILAECSELLENKFPERKILVADICALLAPHIMNNDVSHSLVQTLDQLSCDVHSSVRMAACKNLAIIMETLDIPAAKKMKQDDISLIDQIRMIVFRLMKDSNSDVSTMSSQVTLPVVLHCFRMAQQETPPEFHPLFDFVDSTLDSCENTISSKTTFDVSAMDSMNTLSQTEVTDLVVWMRALSVAVSQLFILSVEQSPFTTTNELLSNTSMNLEIKQQVVARFEEFGGLDAFTDAAKLTETWLHVQNWSNEYEADVEANVIPWTEWQWSNERLLVNIMRTLDPVNRSLIGSLIDVQKRFVLMFDTRAITTQYLTLFSTCDLSDDDGRSPVLLNSQGLARRLRLIPYYVSLLALCDANNTFTVSQYIQDAILHMCAQHKQYGFVPDLEVLKTAVIFVLQSDKNLAEPILQNIIDFVYHPEPVLRAQLASFFSIYIYSLPPSAVVKRILPSLLLLANDMERTVRVSSIAGFSAVLQQHGQSKEVLDRIEIQLSAYIEDPLANIKYELLKTYAHTLSSLEEGFRDSYVIPSLLRWATVELKGRKPWEMNEYESRLKVLVVALQVFQVLSRTFLSESMVSQYILPALSLVKKEIAALDLTSDAHQKKAADGSKNSPADVPPLETFVLSPSDNPFNPLDAYAAATSWVDRLLKTFKGEEVSFSDSNIDESVTRESLNSKREGKSTSHQYLAEASAPSTAFSRDLVTPVEDQSFSAAAKFIRGLSLNIRLPKSTVESAENSSTFPRSVKTPVSSDIVLTSTASTPAKKSTSFFGSKLFQKFHDRSSSLSTSTPVVTAEIVKEVSVEQVTLPAQSETIHAADVKDATLAIERASSLTTITESAIASLPKSEQSTSSGSVESNEKNKFKDNVSSKNSVIAQEGEGSGRILLSSASSSSLYVHVPDAKLAPATTSGNKLADSDAKETIEDVLDLQLSPQHRSNSTTTLSSAIFPDAKTELVEIEVTPKQRMSSTQSSKMSVSAQRKNFFDEDEDEDPTVNDSDQQSVFARSSLPATPFEHSSSEDLTADQISDDHDFVLDKVYPMKDSLPKPNE